MSARRTFTRRTPSWPRDARLAWKGWLEAAQARAAACLRGEPFDRTQEVALAEGGIRAQKIPFPAEDFPAQGMARAWGELARTFVATTGPRRAQMAPALASLSEGLEAVLEDEGLAAMARSRAMIGERD